MNALISMYYTRLNSPYMWCGRPNQTFDWVVRFGGLGDHYGAMVRWCRHRYGLSALCLDDIMFEKEDDARDCFEMFASGHFLPIAIWIR